jgi:large subunit ribosomal protein L11
MSAFARKGARVVKGMKKGVEKVNHPPYLSTIIGAGSAMPAPPLGPQLGQRNIPIGQFCKDFNERTKDLKDGIPLPTRITVNPDKTYSIVINKPPASYYLRMAAGIPKGAMKPSQEIAGKVSLRHIYEIALIKSEDPCWMHIPLERICRAVIGTAHSCGIEVVKDDLDGAEYGRFLEERRAVVQQQETELQETKAAKLLRVAAVSGTV